MSLPVAETGSWKNITGTGAVTPGACKLLRFYVNSTTGGTLVLRDGGASGTQISGTITPAIGSHKFPADIGTSLHVTVANTIDVTFFFIPQS